MFEEAQDAYEHLLVHLTDHRTWEDLWAYISRAEPELHAYLDPRFKNGSLVPANTHVPWLIPGAPATREDGVGQCRPGDCTGAGCWVGVNPDLAVSVRRGGRRGILRGGIVTDCFNCILMGIPCRNRRRRAPEVDEDSARSSSSRYESPVLEEEYDELAEDQSLMPGGTGYHDHDHEEKPQVDFQYEIEGEPGEAHRPPGPSPPPHDCGIPRSDVLAVHDVLVKKAAGLVELSSTTGSEGYMEASEVMFDAAKEIRTILKPRHVTASTATEPAPVTRSSHLEPVRESRWAPDASRTTDTLTETLDDGPASSTEPIRQLKRSASVISVRSSCSADSADSCSATSSSSASSGGSSIPGVPPIAPRKPVAAHTPATFAPKSAGHLAQLAAAQLQSTSLSASRPSSSASGSRLYAQHTSTATRGNSFQEQGMGSRPPVLRPRSGSDESEIDMFGNRYTRVSVRSEPKRMRTK